MDARDMVKKVNFWHAFEMMCAKLGWEKDFRRLVLSRDVDACQTPEKREFIRKVTRILAYNYDVHRCPPTILYPGLFPGNDIKYPPEYRQNQGEN
jgi:hypothetical protein